jgi:hypothetical protein
MLCHGSRLSVVGGERLTPVRSARYSERASSKQYDRRVSRSPVECAPILNMAFKATSQNASVVVSRQDTPSTPLCKYVS